MRKFAILSLAVSAFALFTAPAYANDNGLAAVIHALKKEHGKLCMDGHFHVGTGTSEKSQNIAQEKAVRAWSNLVVLEYGSDWGNFKLAANKGRNCRKNGDQYRCYVEGRPCKR